MTYNEIYKGLNTYTKSLPTDLIEKIDLEKFKDFDYCWWFGDEGDEWCLWAPQDEIITAFAYFYQKNENFENAFNRTLEFYEKTTFKEWSEGRISFLKRLLSS